MHIPFYTAKASVRGAEAETAIPVGGIRAVDKLLAVIKHDAAEGIVEGLDPAAFTVADGAIEAATLDTSGFHLALMWATMPASSES